MGSRYHAVWTWRVSCGWRVWAMALVSLCMATPVSVQAKRVALLIGNQAYAHERPLRNPG